MDELIKQVGQYPGTVGNTVSLVQTIVAVLLSFVLALVIAYVYRETHSGTSYSQSYVHTLIIMGVVVSLIMIIIGSNIARAFSLVGALSIIRFRSAIKESRDVAFIFLVMAIGMACGTQFYGIAIVFTILMSGIVFFLSKMNIGAKPFSEVLLKIDTSKDLDYAKCFKDVFYVQLRSYVLLSIETVSDDMVQLTYSINFKHKRLEKDFLNAIRDIDGCHNVSLITGLQDLQV